MNTATERQPSAAVTSVDEQRDAELRTMLQRSFRPRTNEAADAVQGAVKTLLAFSQGSKVAVHEDVVQTIEQMVAELDRKISRQLSVVMIDPQAPLAQLLIFAGRETTLTGNYEGDVDSWIDRQKHNLESGRRAVVGEIAGEHYRTKLLPEHVVEDYFSAVRRLGTQLGQSGAAASNPMARLFEPVSRQLGLVNGAMQAGQVLPEYDAFSRLRGEAGR